MASGRCRFLSYRQRPRERRDACPRIHASRSVGPALAVRWGRGRKACGCFPRASRERPCTFPHPRPAALPTHLRRGPGPFPFLGQMDKRGDDDRPCAREPLPSAGRGRCPVRKGRRRAGVRGPQGTDCGGWSPPCGGRGEQWVSSLAPSDWPRGRGRPGHPAESRPLIWGCRRRGLCR